MAPRRSFESAKDGSGKATNSSYIHLQSSVSAGEESANTATSNDLWSNGRAEPSNMVPANQHAGIEAPAAPVIVHSSNGGSGEPSALQIQPPEPQHQSSPSPTDSGVGSMVTNGTMISANISLSQQEQSIGHYFKIDNHQMRELDGGLAIRIFHCLLEVLEVRQNDIDLVYKARPSGTFECIFYFDAISKAREGSRFLFGWHAGLVPVTAHPNEFTSATPIYKRERGYRLDSDGQVKYFVSLDGPATDFTAAGAEAKVLQHAHYFGDVHYFSLVSYTLATRECEILVEFDSRDAWEHVMTVTSANGKKAVVPSPGRSTWNLIVRDLVPDLNCENKAMLLEGKTFVSPSQRTGYIWHADGTREPVPGPRILPREYHQHEIIATQARHHSAPDVSDGDNYFGDAAGPMGRSKSSPYEGTIKPRGLASQTIDIQKIIDGLDCRTTIMLRNLPNQLKWSDIKEFADLVAFGKFDFTYLRIDFSNLKNVGYGFINFTDPMSIAAFHARFVGAPWPHQTRAKQPKAAEISYATVQGLENLVERFRNSVVQKEQPECRAKLWWSFDAASATGQAVGTERAFPEPSNHTKLNRSMENARTSGLWNREQISQNHRNRRGQFDRGTPAAQREEYYLGPPVVDAPVDQAMSNLALGPPPARVFHTMLFDNFSTHGYGVYSPASQVNNAATAPPAARSWGTANSMNASAFPFRPVHGSAMHTQPIGTRVNGHDNANGFTRPAQPAGQPSNTQPYTNGQALTIQSGRAPFNNQRVSEDLVHVSQAGRTNSIQHNVIDAGHSSGHAHQTQGMAPNHNQTNGNTNGNTHTSGDLFKHWSFNNARSSSGSGSNGADNHGVPPHF